MKRIILFSVMAFISVWAFAAKSFLPLQCKVSGLRYDNSKVVFFAQHTAKPRLYAIQNIAKHSVWLTHSGNGRGMQAGWDSELGPQHWSALLQTKPRFNLGCHIQKAKAGMRSVPCQQVIRVCQFSWLYSKNPISGGYWVGENLSLSDLMTRIRERGFEV